MRKKVIVDHTSPSSNYTRSSLSLKDAKKELRMLREADKQARKNGTGTSSDKNDRSTSNTADMTASTSTRDLPEVVDFPPPPFGGSYRRSKTLDAKPPREKKSTGTSSRFTKKLTGSSTPSAIEEKKQLLEKVSRSRRRWSDSGKHSSLEHSEHVKAAREKSNKWNKQLEVLSQRDEARKEAYAYVQHGHRETGRRLRKLGIGSRVY